MKGRVLLAPSRDAALEPTLSGTSVPGTVPDSPFLGSAVGPSGETEKLRVKFRAVDTLEVPGPVLA